MGDRRGGEASSFDELMLDNLPHSHSQQRPEPPGLASWAEGARGGWTTFFGALVLLQSQPETTSERTLALQRCFVLVVI